MFGKIDKQLYKAVIYTRQFKVSGVIHLLPEERMTDYLGDQETIFVPITEAVVENLQGEMVAQTPFLCLNKNEVTLLIPEEE